MFSSDPNQPVQNYEIVNPTLEQQVATLLPSVAGYGGNLRSTNTIIPIVDLTGAAEGTTLPESLQQAIAFGSMTAWSCQNTTTALASTTGFWRIFGTATGTPSSSVGGELRFDMTDGVSTKTIWAMNFRASADQPAVSESFDYIVFLAAGESISAVSSAVNFKSQGSYRQVATVDGTLVDPSGFS